MQIVLLSFLLLGQPANGTQQMVVAPGASVTLAWDDTDDAARRYRLWCNKAILKNFAPAEIVRTPQGQAGMVTITANVTTIPAGANSCHVTSYVEIGGQVLESDPSNAIAVAVGTKPPAPSNLRRIVEQLKALLDELADEIERRGGV